MAKKLDRKKLKKLVDEKIKLIEQSPNKYYSAALKEEKRILNELDKLIGDLDTEDGVLKVTQRNINRVAEIEKQLKKSFYKSGYIDATDELIGSLEQVKTLTKDYMTRSFGKIKSNVADVAFNAKKAEAFGILVGTSSMEVALFNPIKQLITDSITNQTTFKELAESLRTTVTGTPELDGKLSKYAKQIAGDTFSTTERNYTKALSEAFDIQFYRYQGGIIEDTRCFCTERNNEYYHIEEIRSWGRGENIGGGCGYPWAGMYKETNENNVMSWLGGYNCKHSLIPVSLILVPSDVIKRAISKGWFDPTPSEIELLGLNE